MALHYLTTVAPATPASFGLIIVIVFIFIFLVLRGPGDAFSAVGCIAHRIQAAIKSVVVITICRLLGILIRGSNGRNELEDFWASVEEYNSGGICPSPLA